MCKNESHSFKETPVKYERQHNTLCILGVQIYKIQSRKEWEMNKLRLLGSGTEVTLSFSFNIHFKFSFCSFYRAFCIQQIKCGYL